MHGRLIQPALPIIGIPDGPGPESRCPACRGAEFVAVATARWRCATCRWLCRFVAGRAVDAIAWTTAGKHKKRGRNR